MYPYIVADIGGTNARFALVTGKNNSGVTLENIKILSTRDHPTLADALQYYLESIAQKPSAICVAVAGPVVGDQVRLTNLNWEFSCEAMAKQFGVQRFIAMNDFAAVAAACSQVTSEHMVEIKAGEIKANATKAVFGPGTGLGVAGLINHNGFWLPNPCEGGHINLAPATEFEAEVVKAGIAQHGHLSAETFLSGPGLVNLYQAICQVKGCKVEQVEPADITRGALETREQVMLDTLSTFCSIAGSFAGNLALTYGAQGGIYLAGGILPRFSEFLIQSDFSERFSSKGVMSHYVAPIPVNLIVHPETAFVGAAAWLEQQLAS